MSTPLQQLQAQVAATVATEQAVASRYAAVAASARIAPAFGTYYLDAFVGAQTNVIGAMGIYDDLAASNMWAQILQDAQACTNQPGGFHAKIVFGTHQYCWQHGVDFVVPANANKTGSSLPVEVHMTVDWGSSIHYLYGDRGFLFSPYTMNGTYDSWDSRAQFNNRFQGVSAYAFKRTATAGVSALAFAALGSSGDNAGGGTSNFRCGQMDFFDANTGGYFLSYMDLSGMFFAQLKGPAGTSAPGAAASYNGVPNPGCQPAVSACNVGQSAIRLSGFNIQFWLWDILPNWLECVLRLTGYCEALMTNNFGGVNCDRGIWSDMANTDFTSLYPGQSSPLFQVVLDPRTEVDCFKIGIDLVRCYILQIYGGRVWTHAIGSATLDGKAYGDVATNGGIILRACHVVKITGLLIDGPAVDSSGSGHTSASGLRGIAILDHTYTGLSAKPNGPKDGDWTYSSSIEIESNGFRGYGNAGKTPPIYIHASALKVTTNFNRWYFAPDSTDGYALGYPVQDDSGRAGGFDYVGTGSTTPAFTATPRSMH